jgi:biotin transport system substrate-specific component
MTTVATLNQAKYDIFRWRYELSVPKKLVLSLGMAVLIGLLAQVRFPLPWSPVPITGQTFAVLLAGVLLGRWWGGAAIVFYAGLGVAGVPWFAPQAGMPAFSAAGVSHLAGPTGGYILGFILAALFLGHFTDKYVRSRSFLSMLGLMLFANCILVYVPGLIWLGMWLNLVSGKAVTFITLLNMGAIPFIAGDVTKAVFAALAARGVTPKKAYGKEVDGDKWAKWRLP